MKPRLSNAVYVPSASYLDGAWAEPEQHHWLLDTAGRIESNKMLKARTMLQVHLKVVEADAVGLAICPTNGRCAPPPSTFHLSFTQPPQGRK
jgi:hypothetical protein